MKLKDLYPGDRVKDSAKDTVFFVAAHDHYAANTTTLITDTNVSYMCFDSAEPDNPMDCRKTSGSNDYPTSNLHQWLNAERSGWYKPQTECDRPPEMSMQPNYGFELPTEPMKDDTQNGFLSGFSKTFIRALKEVDVPCAVTEAEGKVRVTTEKMKVFIPSMDELGFTAGVETSLGSLLKLFEDLRFRYSDFNYWVRTPAAENWEDIVMPPHMRFETVSGVCRDVGGRHGAVHYLGFSNRKACDISGIRPLLNLDSGLELEKDPDENGVCIIKPKSRYCNVSKDIRYNPNCVCFNKTCPSFGFCAECIHHHSPSHPQTCQRPKEYTDCTGCGSLIYPGHDDPSLINLK